MEIPYGSITGPCGHTDDFEKVCTKMDRFTCPQCGTEWHVETLPPTRHPSGWVEPGKRIEHLHPHPDIVRARQKLALAPKPSLARVLAQAAASNRLRTANK